LPAHPNRTGPPSKPVRDRAGGLCWRFRIALALQLASMSDVGRGSREICPVETGYVTMLVHFRLEHLLDGTFCDLLYQTSVAEQVGARLQVQILDDALE